MGSVFRYSRESRDWVSCHGNIHDPVGAECHSLPEAFGGLGGMDQWRRRYSDKRVR